MCATGYVRQGVGEDGTVISVWLFDPDGTVLEGPTGPVSHLACSGVYDWSTGLLYQNGGYFDPNLGIWLALMPLVVIQAWPGKRRRRERHPWVMVLCMGLLALGSLAGCCDFSPPPTPPTCTDLPEGTPQIQSFTATLGEVDVSDSWGQQSLHFGHPRKDGKLPGIILKATVLIPENAAGNFEFVQIGNSETEWRKSSGRCCYKTTLDQWFTDGDPYPLLPAGLSYDNYDDPERPKYTYEDFRYVSSPGIVTLEMADAPMAPVHPFGHPNPLDIEQVSVTEQFETYLMWQSDTGNERIPLGVIGWGWAGKTRLGGNGTWGRPTGAKTWVDEQWRCVTDMRSTSSKLLADIPISCLKSIPSPIRASC